MLMEYEAVCVSQREGHISFFSHLKILPNVNVKYFLAYI